MSNKPAFHPMSLLRRHWKIFGLGCLGGAVACIIAILVIGMMLSSEYTSNLSEQKPQVSEKTAGATEPEAVSSASAPDRDIRYAILGRWKRIEHNLFGYVDTDDTNCAYGVIEEFNTQRFDDIDLLIKMKRENEESGRTMPNAHIDHGSFGIILPDGRSTNYTLRADGTLLFETTGMDNPRGPSNPYAIFSRCEN